MSILGAVNFITHLFLTNSLVRGIVRICGDSSLRPFPVESFGIFFRVLTNILKIRNGFNVRNIVAMDGDLPSCLTKSRFNAVAKILGPVDSRIDPSPFVFGEEHVLGNEEFPLLFTDFRVEVLGGLTRHLVVKIAKDGGLFFGRQRCKFRIFIPVKYSRIEAAGQFMRLHEVGTCYSLVFFGCGERWGNAFVKIVFNNRLFFVFRKFPEFAILIKTQDIGIKHGQDLLSKILPAGVSRLRVGSPILRLS